MRVSLARCVKALTTCLFATATGTIAAAAPPPSPRPASPIVMELFTSQGCSSCPPADALLGQYVGRDDVLPLSLPVDYWDRLGWKDTFAKPAFTERQRAYARFLKANGVFTPEVVIGGRLSAVGSSRDEIEHAIATAKADTPACAVHLDAKWSTGSLTVSMEKDATPSAHDCTTPAVLYLAEVQRSGRVQIARGENAGRTVTYHNVVASLSSVLTWDGRTAEQQVVVDAKLEGADRFYVVLLQASATGHILAAHVVEAAGQLD